MNGRKYAPTATRKRQNGWRGPLAILLTIVLPPVGILVLWRLQIYRTRGRVLLTVLGTAILTAFFMATMPTADVVAATPAISSTSLFTAAPESDVLTALSSLEEIARAQVPEAEDEDSTVIQVSQENQIAAQQALLDTIVYSVYNHAKYYHKASDCNGQNNRRELTIRDALKEGLAPCPECDPPIYEAISYDTPVIEPNNLEAETSGEDLEFGAESSYPEVFTGTF